MVSLLEPLDRRPAISPEGDAPDLFDRLADNPPDDDLPNPGHGDYWALRVAYPTGRFSGAWLLDAARQDASIDRAVPAGRNPYDSRGSLSPLSLDPTAFTSLGPRPLDMDACVGCLAWGLAGGRTNVIAVDPVSPNVAYFGSDGGGVWKTENCCSTATTWSPKTDGPLLTSISIGDIVIDPNDHETVYAGTGDLRYGSWSFGSAGLLKSTDRGESWEILGAEVFNPVYTGDLSFPQYQAIGKVRVDPADSDRLVVGTKTGIHLSYDAGATWTDPCLTNPFTDQRQDTTGLLVRATGEGTEIIAAIGTRGFDTPVQPDLDLNGANGIYRATLPPDGCPTDWRLLSRPDNGWPAGSGGGAPYPANSLGRIDLARAPGAPDVLYAQVAAIPSRGQLGVWRSTDGGVIWEQRSNVSGLNGCFGDYPQNWYDAGITVDPNDPDTVFMSTVDLFRSTDGGVDFTNLTCGLADGTEVHVDHHARAFVGGSSSDLLVGTDGGVYFSDNADAPSAEVSFENLNQSLSTLELYSGDITADFAVSAMPGITAGAQDNGSMVHRWTGAPGPAVWSMTFGADGVHARIEPVRERRWYLESQYGNLRMSTDGPYGPYYSARGDWASDRKSFLMPYEIYKYDCPESGCSHLIAGTYRVWETIEGADDETWYVNSPDLTKGVLGNRSFINQLSYSVSDQTVAVVGSNDGNFWYGFDLGRGTATSAGWVDVTGGNLVLPNRPVMDVTTDPLMATTGYAALGGFAANTPGQPGHVYRITCDFNCSNYTWEDVSGNLPDIPVNSILVNPHIPEQVFAGSDWGLYFTNDVTETPPVWRRFTDGLPSVMIWDMSIDRGFTTLALFTRSRGAYVWPLPTAIDEPIFADGFESGDTSAWSAVVP